MLAKFLYRLPIASVSARFSEPVSLIFNWYTGLSEAWEIA
jgi:hypothetical protein